MNPTILLPELPDTTDPKAVKDYLAAHQKILADKQKSDYEANADLNGKVYNGSNHMSLGYMHVRDEKPSGTVGGTGTAGAWNIRTLNTIKSNTITNASLSSNNISIPSGKYRIKASAPAYMCNTSKLRLFNVTDNIVIDYGTNDHQNAIYGGTGIEEISIEISLSKQTEIRLDHYIGVTTGGTQTLGIAVSLGTEVYSKIEIWEVPEILPLVPLASETGIATQAEAQTGTNNTKIITPLSLRQGLNANGSAPVYACRAWVNFDGTGTVAIRASGNVSSITDNGVSIYTINFITPMEDINYCAIASSNAINNSGNGYIMTLGLSNYNTDTLSTYRTVSSIRVLIPNPIRDVVDANVAIFR